MTTRHVMEQALRLAATKWKGRKFEDTPFRHSAMVEEDLRANLPPDDWEPPAGLAMQTERAEA